MWGHRGLCPLCLLPEWPGCLGRSIQPCYPIFAELLASSDHLLIMTDLCHGLAFKYQSEALSCCFQGSLRRLQHRHLLGGQLPGPGEGDGGHGEQEV